MINIKFEVKNTIRTFPLFIECCDFRDSKTQRSELQDALCRYTAYTLIYIDTVRRFCERSSRWMLGRELELDMLMDIKERANKIDLNIDHVTKSENKGAALWEYVKSKFTQVTADSRRAKLQKELAAVLKATLGGLEELDRFLDAAEKLAVTSLHVFTVENQVLHLPEGMIPEQVQVVIDAARLICPLLLEFKRDASVFFLPKLQNVEVLSYQLDKYIQTTQKICDKLEKSSFSHFNLRMVMDTVVELDVDLSEDDVQRMLYHINQLDDIRKNQHFRMVFLFQEESGSCFIDEFCKRQPRMLKFLNDLEENAVQLDRMNKGSRISSVAGSSVGAVGGVLSIVGLALIPVTAGASLALTMTGVGMGVTSGVNSLVTTATEIGVNRKHQKEASETFQSFMEDVQILQDCLDEVTKREPDHIDVALGVGKVLVKVATTGKGIDALVDGASAFKMLKSEELIASAGKVVAQEGKALRNVPRLASDIPDIGQAAVKGPLALSKSARAGFIVANAFFLGMDIFFICKDSISLSKGSETEFSQFIRTRSALWRSEMDSWQKISDSLREGRPTSEKNIIILETPFYPERR
ncbi:Apolipoprotein L6 [Nibea albiflora]|uniref:Apolipoprotein L6 n=1 Tax=Nibea albiflora TaxID=240163 RepID=A0ACB7EXK2_NIBAL|nr:Apolipoprotein L6 [Nibea albiflora]